MANFEDHLTQLETVVERLERGDLSLDDSVRLFEEGMLLSAACKQELEQAEGRIQMLVKGTQAEMQPVDMELRELNEDGMDSEEEEE